MIKIYENIVDIFNQSYKEDRKPKIRERFSYEIVGAKTIIIDVPKKSKLHYHSSSYVIECDENEKKCRMDGNLVADLNSGDSIRKNLDEIKCKILAIHDHDMISIKDTQVHFRCKDKTYDETISIAKFIGKF
jgi:hypothetical protein